MNEYYVYCIKEEFADYYFYKCDLLYRFLKRFQETKERPDLVDQFNYITIEYPVHLLTYIHPNLKETPSIKIAQKDNQLHLFTDSGYLVVYLEKNRLIVRCTSLQDAETILFPALKSFYPYLFIIGMNVDEYGWMSPHILKKSFLKEKQILYSYP